MTIRLDPAVPVLWRTPFSLQVGAGADASVLEPLSAADETLVAALRIGTARRGLDAIAKATRLAPGSVDALLARLAPHLLDEGAIAPAVLVVGDGRLASPLTAVWPRPAASASPRFVVIAADWLVTPADAAVWLRRDVPHLPVITGDRRIAVGPLVVPGRGACLHCVDHHRIDADAAWPAIAAQLLALPAPEVSAVRVAQAIALVEELRRDAPRTADSAAAVEWSIDTRSGEVSARAWPPHPECRCGAQPGSDWTRGAVPRIRRRTSPPPSAAPAAAWPA